MQLPKPTSPRFLPRRGKVQSLITSHAKNFTGEEVAAGQPIHVKSTSKSQALVRVVEVATWQDTKRSNAV